MPPSDLFQVAERLVRKRGIAALTMDSLAEAAGVSRATVYRKLGSREALLDRLAQRGIETGERKDVRQRILDAAEKHFLRLGLEAATVEAIAAEAGVGPATVYRHFGDKQGLIEAFLSSRSPRRAAWSISRKPTGDLRADLTQLGRTVLEFLMGSGGMFRLALLSDRRASGFLAELARSPDRTVHACAALLEHYMGTGALAPRDPHTLARIFLGMLLSFGMLEALLGVPLGIDPEQHARLAVEIFLDGAQGHAAGHAAAQVSQTRRRRRTS